MPPAGLMSSKNHDLPGEPGNRSGHFMVRRSFFMAKRRTYVILYHSGQPNMPGITLNHGAFSVTGIPYQGFAIQAGPKTSTRGGHNGK